MNPGRKFIEASRILGGSALPGSADGACGLPVPTEVWGMLAAHASPLSGQMELTAPPVGVGAPQGRRRQGSGRGVAEAGRRAAAGGHSLWSLCLLRSLCAGCTCSPVSQGQPGVGVLVRPGKATSGHGGTWLALPALNPVRDVRAGPVLLAPLVQAPLSRSVLRAQACLTG